MSSVSVSIGKTYNMGNYESLRIDVGCTMDTDEWLGSDQEAYEEVSKKSS